MKEFLVQALSEETPYLVAAVPHGFQALEVVKVIKPHLFLLDYLLPGMNGLELYDPRDTQRVVPKRACP